MGFTCGTFDLKLVMLKVVDAVHNSRPPIRLQVGRWKGGDAGRKGSGGIGLRRTALPHAQLLIPLGRTHAPLVPSAPLWTICGVQRPHVSIIHLGPMGSIR